MDKMDRQERLERTASMAYNKGLINNPGENNCFLNSAVQVSKKYLLAEIFNGSLVVTGKNRGRFLPHKSKLINALNFVLHVLKRRVSNSFSLLEQYYGSVMGFSVIFVGVETVWKQQSDR